MIFKPFLSYAVYEGNWDLDGAGAVAATGAGAGVEEGGADDEADGVTRSNSEFEAPFDGCSGGAADEEAGEASKRDMMSAAADLVGAEGAGAGAAAGASEREEPKISANKSWVDGPLAAVGRPAEGGALSSPMRSAMESLSVRVEPTGLRSLTASLARASPADK